MMTRDEYVEYIVEEVGGFISDELPNIENVARLLRDGYYSDSIHDEVMRSSDALLVIFNEHEYNPMFDKTCDYYGIKIFNTEYAGE